MLKVHRIVNGIHNSCTYILNRESDVYVWLIDCGDYNIIKEWVDNYGKIIKGVFLTHGHLDHIYGLKELLYDLPEMPIYLSENGGVKCMQNIRLNISRFTSNPFIIESHHFNELKEGDTICLFDDTILKVYQTEGHSPDSLVYKVNDYLFTGDAYIPNCDVVTKLPGGDKIKAEKSLNRILKILKDGQLKAMPGHRLND